MTVDAILFPQSLYDGPTLVPVHGLVSIVFEKAPGKGLAGQVPEWLIRPGARPLEVASWAAVVWYRRGDAEAALVYDREQMPALRDVLGRLKVAGMK